MDQGTHDWLMWRKEGIGSSDVAAVLGISPWKTKFQLWEEKVSEDVKENERSFIKDKGHRFEAKVRALFELHWGGSFEPALCQMQQFPYMRCSLDGRSPDKKTIVEIKLVGKDKQHRARTLNEVPEYYMVQIQHQLLVSGADKCFYLSYEDEGQTGEIKLENLVVIEVSSDKKKQGEIIEECARFWQCVLDRKPTELSDKDWKSVKGHAALVNKWKRLKLKEKQIKEELETARESLIEIAKGVGHPRLMMGDVRFTHISKVGSVDYKRIPELKGVDLDKYRKAGSTYWEMEIKK